MILMYPEFDKKKNYTMGIFSKRRIKTIENQASFLVWKFLLSSLPSAVALGGNYSKWEIRMHFKI